MLLKLKMGHQRFNPEYRPRHGIEIVSGRSRLPSIIVDSGPGRVLKLRGIFTKKAEASTIPLPDHLTPETLSAFTTAVIADISGRIGVPAEQFEEAISRSIQIEQQVAAHANANQPISKQKLNGPGMPYDKPKFCFRTPNHNSLYHMVHAPHKFFLRENYEQ